MGASFQMNRLSRIAIRVHSDPRSRAGSWCTAGDVYAALCKALPAEEVGEPGTWERFAAALGRETGVSASRLTPQSELLSEDGLWISVANGSAMFWSAAALAAVVGIGWLLLR